MHIQSHRNTAGWQWNQDKQTTPKQKDARPLCQPPASLCCACIPFAVHAFPSAPSSWQSQPQCSTCTPQTLCKAFGKGQISSFLSQLRRQHLSSLTEINLGRGRGDELKASRPRRARTTWRGSLHHQHLVPVCPSARHFVSTWGRLNRPCRAQSLELQYVTLMGWGLHPYHVPLSSPCCPAATLLLAPRPAGLQDRDEIIFGCAQW